MSLPLVPLEELERQREELKACQYRAEKARAELVFPSTTTPDKTQKKVRLNTPEEKGYVPSPLVPKALLQERGLSFLAMFPFPPGCMFSRNRCHGQDPYEEYSAGDGHLGSMGECPDEAQQLREEVHQLYDVKHNLHSEIDMLQQQLASLKIHVEKTKTAREPPADPAPVLPSESHSAEVNDDAVRKRLARLCAKRSDGPFGLHSACKLTGALHDT